MYYTVKLSYFWIYNVFLELIIKFLYGIFYLIKILISFLILVEYLFFKLSNSYYFANFN